MTTDAVLDDTGAYTCTATVEGVDTTATVDVAVFSKFRFHQEFVDKNQRRKLVA